MAQKYQNVFKRYEKKYLLNHAQYNRLRNLLTAYMQEDDYGLHTICNLYFDTDNYWLIRTSLAKPVYKEKLRLRSYGVPSANDSVFLELKKKYDGVVYKRRTKMTLAEAYAYLLHGIAPKEDTQILHEFDWFLSHTDVSPKTFIAYDRIALFGKEDPELRITFDSNLRSRENQLDLTCGDEGQNLTEADDILMEIKLTDAMPLWLSHILAECEIYPSSFSKYGVCYTNTICQKQIATKGGVFCA